MENTRPLALTVYPKQPKPINMVEIESKRWATALSGLIDERGHNHQQHISKNHYSTWVGMK